jgi:peptide/nickel transport system permease protein
MAVPSIDRAEMKSGQRCQPLPAKLVIGGSVLAIVFVIAAGAEWLAPFPFDEIHIADRLTGPSLQYLAGTDEYGRDVLSRVLVGSRLSLFLGFAATSISLLVGVLLGMIAGFFRGRVDELLMRSIDIVMSFPPLMLVLLIIAVTPPSLWKTSVAIGILFIPPIARIARSVTLDLMTGDFVVAAQARGEHVSYIIVRELLPNVWPAIVVEGSLRFAFAMLLGATLSFLGFGVQPPAADWGLIISNGRNFLESAPWIIVAPGAAMCITVIAVSMFGDGLREHLDPRVGGRL